MIGIAVLVGCGHESASDDAPADAAAVPTTSYHRDVAPILARNCTTCHRDGGLGPVPLTAFGDAREAAGAIADATGRHRMPPWPADGSGACNTFVGRRSLDARDITTLATWAAEGAPEGDPRDAVFVAPPPELPFTSSLELEAPAPYTVAVGPDEYRCFVIDPGLTSDRYITAVAALLDKEEVVHHIQLFSADTDQARTSIAARDAQDPAPGYSCDDEGVGTNLRYIGVWAAGDRVRRWPDTTGIRVPAGSHLVFQVHYHNHGTLPVSDRSRLALELAQTVDWPATIWSGSAPVSLPPGQAEVVTTASTTLPVTAVSWARALRIHMHTLGAHARMELVRGGQTQCLLDIPRWDFGWQLFYTLEQPIGLEVGDKLRLTCAYDTTSRATTTLWGASTEDEMCLGYVYFTD